ncbi:hypothetical protein HK100_011932 [Physocladia obscura]|uniref:Protein kinase domain-containing protein n=1 Tax=Physocladia obscura TaxID=109957 RepID=A0AAD5TCM6_9FUNG|nr:hypothetical protein HK100_011932 [Physocladia obscura]
MLSDSDSSGNNNSSTSNAPVPISVNGNGNDHDITVAAAPAAATSTNRSKSGKEKEKEKDRAGKGSRSRSGREKSKDKSGKSKSRKEHTKERNNNNNNNNNNTATAGLSKEEAMHAAFVGSTLVMAGGVSNASASARSGNGGVALGNSFSNNSATTTAGSPGLSRVNTAVTLVNANASSSSPLPLASDSAAAAAAAAAAPPVRAVRIDSVIGSGSFSYVYLAHEVDLSLPTTTALTTKPAPPPPPIRRAVKRLFKDGLDAKQLELQRQEVVIMKDLCDHSSVVPLLGTVEDSECLYLIMDYCEMDLYDAITKRGGFSDTAVKRIFSQIVDAVIHCHSKGIYHRDLKPENCLIVSSNSAPTDYSIKLTDFGLATSEKWSTEMGCGSVRYMAPECFDPHYVSSNPNIKQSKDKKQPGPFVSMSSKNGYPPASSDVWSLGVILVNLLFAKNPWFEAHPSDPIFSSFVSSNPNILRQQFSLSPHFDALLRRCFDLDPRRRCSVHDLKVLVDTMPRFVGGCVPGLIVPHGPGRGLMKDESAAAAQKRNRSNSPKLGSDGSVSSRNKTTPGLIIPPGVSIPLEQIRIIFDKPHECKSSGSRPLSSSSNATIVTDEIIDFPPSETVNSQTTTSASHPQAQASEPQVQTPKRPSSQSFATFTPSAATSNPVVHVIAAPKPINKRFSDILSPVSAVSTTPYETGSLPRGLKQTGKFYVHQQQLLQQPLFSNGSSIKSDNSSGHFLNFNRTNNNHVRTTTMASGSIKTETTGGTPAAAAAAAAGTTVGSGAASPASAAGGVGGSFLGTSGFKAPSMHIQFPSLRRRLSNSISGIQTKVRGFFAAAAEKTKGRGSSGGEWSDTLDSPGTERNHRMGIVGGDGGFLRASIIAGGGAGNTGGTGVGGLGTIGKNAGSVFRRKSFIRSDGGAIVGSVADSGNDGFFKVAAATATVVPEESQQPQQAKWAVAEKIVQRRSSWGEKAVKSGVTAVIVGNSNDKTKQIGRIGLKSIHENSDSSSLKPNSFFVQPSSTDALFSNSPSQSSLDSSPKSTADQPQQQQQLFDNQMTSKIVSGQKHRLAASTAPWSKPTPPITPEFNGKKQ